MDCRLTQLELVDFQFGTLDFEIRNEVESHLCQCGSCLSSYMRLKRNLETGQAETTLVPSIAAREKLRRAVQEKFGKTFFTEARRVLSVSVPLYQVAAALLLVIGAVFFRMMPVTSTRRPAVIDAPDTSSATAVDESYSVPKSLNYL